MRKALLLCKISFSDPDIMKIQGTLDPRLQTDSNGGAVVGAGAACWSLGRPSGDGLRGQRIWTE